MKKLHKIGEFYTRIIIKNVGIFIFIGLLFVVFNDHGWFPDENMYAISQLVYEVILPSLIAYEGGRAIHEKGGGVQAVLAVSGILVFNSSAGILGAMILGPFAGFLWKYEEAFLKKRMNSSMQMLARNLTAGVTGALLAALGVYILSPLLGTITGCIYHGVDFLLAHHMIAPLSILIEPAKIFFLNNIVNHAVLVPLGMAQVQDAGQSILFLLESNPGPGFGVMAALCYVKKERRNEYASAMIAESLGGIHEVYFPFILSDLRLIFPLILGGMAGSICFETLNTGLQGVVSPGSVLIILLMSGKGTALPVFFGILVSAVIAFAGSFLILSWERKPKVKKDTTQQEQNEREKEEIKEMKKIEMIAVVCDGGVGSSAMGAALLRRTLARENITGVRAEAHAADLLPENIDMIVCQKDFYRLHPGEWKDREVYTVESLVQTDELKGLTELIQKRNG